ncbi:molybdenum ABC transporter substrate-binding protein [Haloglomus irregulare]|uniref:Molybdenum ABC transporter substrate-binding protein n=1 Tax=Haloglomus irregulare TaxID=2234134 RepID=A0A554MXV1_9EURY|nr:extracellular solute-binding protein [Haloglomus irregulare]TSD09954.1 molybdenum ABC transporter substrate-binding protein [Haloglomus irregulare]
MTEHRTRRAFLASSATAAAIGLAGCTGDGGSDGGGSGDGGSDGGGDSGTPTSTPMSDSMTIFHAGSLAPPFSAAEPQFEEEFDVDVNREAKGSVASTQKITQQGRSADVLGTSDFRLIRNRVLPDYGDWYAIFTTNSMSIQYREDSPGADDISADNWWDVLSRDGVTIGHSDPAVDPGGYRAVMTLQLGAEEFQGERLYDEGTLDALMSNTTVPTGTETNLEGQLESGELDYVLYYQSISATSGLPYVDLQPEVDLSQATSEYAQHYAKAEVETDSGTFTGAPIAYGLTVPSVAEAPGRGAQWIEYFATEPGRAILEEQGLVPVDPIVVPASSEDAVPDNVMEVASAQSSLGPLEL